LVLKAAGGEALRARENVSNYYGVVGSAQDVCTRTGGHNPFINHTMLLYAKIDK